MLSQVQQCETGAMPGGDGDSLWLGREGLESSEPKRNLEGFPESSLAG